MQHREWNEKFLAAINNESDEALEQLLEDTRVASKENVGDWHVRQLLGLLSLRKEEQGDRRGRLNYKKEIIDTLRNSMKEIDIAMGTAAAEVALEYFETKDSELAYEYSQTSLESLSRTQDPSSIFMELIEAIKNNRINQK